MPQDDLKSFVETLRAKSAALKTQDQPSEFSNVLGGAVRNQAQASPAAQQGPDSSSGDPLRRWKGMPAWQKKLDEIQERRDAVEARKTADPLRPHRDNRYKELLYRELSEAIPDEELRWFYLGRADSLSRFERGFKGGGLHRPPDFDSWKLRDQTVYLGKSVLDDVDLDWRRIRGDFVSSLQRDIGKFRGPNVNNAKWADFLDYLLEDGGYRLALDIPEANKNL